METQEMMREKPENTNVRSQEVCRNVKERRDGYKKKRGVIPQCQGDNFLNSDKKRSLPT